MYYNVIQKRQPISRDVCVLLKGFYWLSFIYWGVSLNCAKYIWFKYGYLR